MRLRPGRPRHPLLSALRTRQRRLARVLRDHLARTRFADRQAADPLPVVVVRHASPLRRRLAGTDPRLQETKVISTLTVGATDDISSTSGRAVRADLSCGRLDVWSGPPLLGPMYSPGPSGDCE